MKNLILGFVYIFMFFLQEWSLQLIIIVNGLGQVPKLTPVEKVYNILKCQNDPINMYNFMCQLFLKINLQDLHNFSIYLVFA
jgi:hypothetical protein